MSFFTCYKLHSDYIFSSCALAENKHVRSACNGPEEEKDYDSGNFYKLFHVAEVHVWRLVEMQVLWRFNS